MEKYRTLQEDIENASNNEVVKRNTVSGMAVGLLIVAVACAIAGTSFEDPNSVVPTFFFTAAAILLLAGVVKFLTGRSGYWFNPTKSRLKKVTAYFDVRESDALQACVEMKRFEELKRLKRERDTGVRLEVMVADDGKFAAVQVAEYVPHTYEAVTPVRCYYGEEAKTLVSCLKV